MLRRLLPAIALLAAAGAAAVPRADDGPEDDHERAREAVRRGEILPLDRLLGRVRRDFRGELLGVELESERHAAFDAPLVYEVRLLAEDGTVRELYYDARTGRLLQARGDGLDDRDRHRDDEDDQEDDDDYDEEDDDDDADDGGHGWFDDWFEDDD